MDIGRIGQNNNYLPQTSAAPKEIRANSQEISDSVSLDQNKPETDAKVPKKWLIMHYGAADNNLTSYMEKDVNEMEAVGSTDKMDIFVQFDPGGDKCKRYVLKKDNDMNNITSPVAQEMGSVDMADPKELKNFLVWGLTNHPAEHSAVIISNHGAGWPGAISDDGSGGFMTTPNIRRAIEEAEKETGKKIDLMGFDACLMATSEVAYELKDAFNYFVASEESEGGSGWPYTPVLTSKSLGNIERAIRSKLDVTPKEFAEKIVSEASSHQGDLPTLSAVDLSKMNDVAKASDKFAEAILGTNTPNSVFKEIARKTERFSSGKDQYHFAELITKENSITDKNLKAAAKEMMKAIKNAVIAEEHSTRIPNAHGLTAEIPSYGSVGYGYTDLKFAQDTKWDEAMNKFSK